MTIGAISRLVMLLALGLGAAATAARARTLELVEGARESSLELLTLPSSTAGALTFKTCAGCDSQSLLLSVATVYVTPRGPMPFADFVVYVEALRRPASGSQSALVTLFFDPETRRVTRIVVHETAAPGRSAESASARKSNTSRDRAWARR